MEMSTREVRSLRSRGSALMELAVAMPLLVVLMCGTVDLGRMFHAQVEVTNAARAGAGYGSRTAALSSDNTGMQTAALNDVQDLTAVTVTPSRTCKCSNGTVVNCTSGTCAGTKRIYVTVLVTKVFTPVVNYWVLPSSVTLSGTATIRAQ